MIANLPKKNRFVGPNAPTLIVREFDLTEPDHQRAFVVGGVLVVREVEGRSATGFPKAIVEEEGRALDWIAANIRGASSATGVLALSSQRAGWRESIAVEYGAEACGYGVLAHWEGRRARTELIRLSVDPGHRGHAIGAVIAEKLVANLDRDDLVIDSGRIRQLEWNDDADYAQLPDVPADPALPPVAVGQVRTYLQDAHLSAVPMSQMNIAYTNT